MSHSPLKPPTDLDAAALFELLSERRPRWPLDVRFSDGPEVGLFAQAMTPIEWAHVGRDHKAALLYSLCTEEGRVFETLSDVGQLRVQEAKRLAEGLRAGLDICAPTWGRINWPAWEAVLRQGAERSGSVAVGWAECEGYTERYWGVPRADVLDGHRMVHIVSNRLAESRRSK